MVPMLQTMVITEVDIMHMAEIRCKLYKYPQLKDEVRKLDELIEEEQFRLLTYYGCGSQEITGMPGSSSPGDPTGNTAAAKAIPLKQRLDILKHWRDSKLAAMCEVEAFLERIDALERPVIEMHYFQRRPFIDVAPVLYLSRSTVLRLHASGLGKWKIETV